MNWTGRVASVVAVALLLAAGCSGDTDDADTIVIGLMTDLSGDLVAFGRDIEAATAIAAARVNDDGGIDGTPLEVRVVDTGGVADSAVIGFRTLADAGVFAVSGPISSGEAEVVFAQAAEREVPVITGTANKEGITEVGASWAFRNTATNTSLYEVAMPRWADAFDIETAVLVYDEERAVSRAAALGAIPAVSEAAGIAVSAETITFVTGQNDFTATVQRIGNVEGDGLIILSGPAEAGLLARELARQGEDRPVLGHPAQNNEDFMIQAGGQVDAWVLPSIFDSRRQDALTQAFLSAMTEIDGEHPAVPEAANYFDNILMLAHVMREAGITANTPADEARAAIRDGLLALTAFEGAAGEISFRPNGDALKPVYVVVVSGAEVEPLE